MKREVLAGIRGRRKGGLGKCPQVGPGFPWILNGYKPARCQINQSHLVEDEIVVCRSKWKYALQWIQKCLMDRKTGRKLNLQVRARAPDGDPSRMGWMGWSHDGTRVPSRLPLSLLFCSHSFHSSSTPQRTFFALS